METKMILTIEQKLAVLKKAIELGADIDIYFHGSKDKEQAYQTANPLSTMMNVEIEELESDPTKWLKIHSANRSGRLDVKIFYAGT